MASAFNLTAQLNLKGPTNVAAIVGNINKQLTAINANVNIKINPSAQNTVTQLNSSFQTFNRTLSQTTTNTNAVAAALNSLRTSIGQVNNPLNNLLQNLQNNANAANQFNQNLRNTQQACNRAATTIEEMGRQAGANVRRFAAFATVTGSIYKFGNALNAAAKEFVEFNKELVRVAQVTDTNISGLKGLVAEITALSTGFGIASNDLIKVSSTLAQAGLSARDTEKALKALALSALAPSFDSLNDTVEGSIALMRQFGISADDLEGALGSVNAVAAKFAVEASDIITAIQRTGGVFATASRGVSQGKDALNEFIAVFTSIRATTRESAETISTGLRTIFTRIQRKDTIDALKEYGVVLTDLTGKFVGPFEATKRLSEGLSKLDPRDIRFSQIVEELGGFRQIGKVIPLIQQFATAQQALKVAQQGQASLAADAAVAQESVANRITKVREEFIALIRSIGESSSFQTFVKLTLDLASALIRLADAAKNVLPAITAIAAVRGAGAVAQFGRGFIGGLTGNRRNAGGPITRFASGGFVPGQGNSDTVPAMLTPGEFVIRKKAVQALGVDRLASMNRYAGGGIVDDLSIDPRVGAAILEYRSRGSDNKTFKVNIEGKSKTVLGQRQGLNEKTNQSFNRAINEGIIRGVNYATRLVSKDLGVPSTKIPKDAQNDFLSGINDASRGNLFEDILRTMQAGPFGKTEAQRPFDFPNGVPTQLKDNFNTLPDKWIDAKASFDAAKYVGDGSLQAKTQRQIDMESGAYRQPRQKGIEALSAQKSGGYNSDQIRALTGMRTKDLVSRGLIVKRNNNYYLQEEEKFAKGGMAKFSLEQQRDALLLYQAGSGPFTKALASNKSVFSDRGEKYKTKDIQEKLLSTSTFNLPKSLFSGLGPSQIREIIKDTQVSEKDLAKNPKKVFPSMIGKTIDFPVFLSTSPKNSVAKNFVGDPGGMLNINASKSTTKGIDVLKAKGQKGFNPNNTLPGLDKIGKNKINAYDKEQEYILPPNTKFKINSISGSVSEYLAEDLSSSKNKSGGKKDFIDPWLLDELLSDDFVKTKLNIKAQLFNKGGSASDTVPALLTPGEFVINKKAAQRIGLSTLHRMNHADKVQGYASGGVVQKFKKGGTPAPDPYQNIKDKTSSWLANQNQSKNFGYGAASPGLVAMAQQSQSASGGMFGGGNPANILGTLVKSANNASAQLQALTTSITNATQATNANAQANQTSATATNTNTRINQAPTTRWGNFKERMRGSGGMMLAMGGQMAIERISGMMGGEKTAVGRNVSAIGGNILNYGAAGAAVLGPFGAAAGAAVGLVAGLIEAEKASKEFAVTAAEEAKNLAAEKSGKAIEAYATKPTAAGRSAALTMLGETSAKEEELSKSIREKSKGSALTRFFTLGFAGKEADTATVVEEQLKAQSVGAEQAIKFVSIEMQKSGKTFAELSKTMNPAELAKLQNDIAQADRSYIYAQEQNAKEVAELRSEEKNAEADQVAAQGVERQKQLAEVITKRQMAENDAAIQAQRNAKEAQRLAIALRKATMTIESTFDAVGQALSSSSFEMNQLDNRTAQIVSGVSKPENMFEKNINVLKNPMAYSQQERQAAENAVSPLLGNQAGLVTGVAKLGGLKNKAIEAGLAKEMVPGASQDEVISAVAGSLRSQIGNTFGPNSDAARTFNDQITKLANQLQEAGGNLSAAEIADQLSGGLDEASKKAAAIQEQANQLLAESFNKLSNIGNQLSAVQQKQIERGRELADMQAANTFALKDALGIRVSSQERITQRNQQAASRLGFQDPNQVTTASVIGRYGQLQAGRSAAEANVSAMSAAGAAGVNNQLIQASKTLSDFDSEIKNIEQEISNLPKTLQSNLDDIFGEMKQRVSQLEGAKQAGGNFAERLVTSTPQELMELNNTFNLMNSTLNGNVTTIQQSQSAQKAYYTALMNGKSAQEAMTDAQQAFATENKNALALFKDLSEVAGVQGPEFDRMKADLLEGFAKAQGLQNFKPLQMMIAKLRETPEQRAANDPILMALRNQADTIARAQADAVALANEIDRQKQAELLTNVGNEIIRKLQATPIRVEVAVGNMMAANANLPAPVVQQQRRSKGGLIYASKGMYVNYQAKGTDTVPAMLTPGEFVVNASATRKNLPLLKSINRANGGLMPQAGLNKAFGNMPADQTMSNMFFSPQATNMYANMNPMREAIMRNIPLPQVLQERKKRAQERITGPYLQRKKQAESRKAYIAEMRRRKEQLIDPYIKKPKYKAAGGTIVPYEPKGTDTVPAMLSPGEFVVNRASTQRNLPLLKTINRAKGGPVQYLQDGTPSLMGNGVSNGMDQLGSRFDRFIDQLQQVLPPVIKVEGIHRVDVIVNGASVLADILNGPIGNIVKQAVQSAFDQKSRDNEGN